MNRQATCDWICCKQAYPFTTSSRDQCRRQCYHMPHPMQSHAPACRGIEVLSSGSVQSQTCDCPTPSLTVKSSARLTRQASQPLRHYQSIASRIRPATKPPALKRSTLPHNSYSADADAPMMFPQGPRGTSRQWPSSRRVQIGVSPPLSCEVPWNVYSYISGCGILALLSTLVNLVIDRARHKAGLPHQVLLVAALVLLSGNASAQPFEPGQGMHSAECQCST